MKEENTNDNAIAVRETNDSLLAVHAGGVDIVDRQLQAELEKSLKQLSVADIVSPTSLIPDDKPLSESKVFDMLDCFEFEIMDNGQPKDILIYICDFGKDGIKTVGQSLAGSRERWKVAFDNARVSNKELRLTNLQFVRLNKGGKMGNLPIVIKFTKDSKPIITEKVN